MNDYMRKLLPRFRYGVIQPRAHEEVQRARSYQLYRLLPLDFIEISTGLGLENYTKQGVEKAIELKKREVKKREGSGLAITQSHTRFITF